MSLSDQFTLARFSFGLIKVNLSAPKPSKDHNRTSLVKLIWQKNDKTTPNEQPAFRSFEDAEYDSPDSQANGNWDDSGDDVNDQAFFFGAERASTGTKYGKAAIPPKEKLGSFPEYEFCLLPTQTNSDAYSLAYNLIRESIFNFGRKHFFEICDPKWDAVCDVNLERAELNAIFGRYGFATQELDAAKQEEFVKVINDLPHLRHRVAHPADTVMGDASVQFVCRHISYARSMAVLLGDQAVVQKLDALLEDLQEQGRDVLQHIEGCKTLAGRPDGKSWPRHCERLFHFVDAVRTACPAEPSSPYEWEKHQKWNRVPAFLREATADWVTQYDAPGVKKPDWAL